MSEWTFGQRALVVLASLQLLWAAAGFIAEPSFHLGADAPTEKVLGVDFNGVHALSGFLLFLPAFYFARRPDWALYYDVNAAAALYITGIWGLLRRAAGLGLHLPQQLRRRGLPPRHRHSLRHPGGDPGQSKPRFTEARNSAVAVPHPAGMGTGHVLLGYL